MLYKVVKMTRCTSSRVCSVQVEMSQKFSVVCRKELNNSTGMQTSDPVVLLVRRFERRLLCLSVMRANA